MNQSTMKLIPGYEAYSVTEQGVIYSHKKPGGKGKGEGLSKMQSELNKQIEQLKNGMKPGQKPGKGQMSQQMAQMAAQQQAIRNAMDQLSQQMDKNGQGGNGKEISQLKKEMEKTESDLYNKNINQQTINRQQEIMSRLLATEKAIKEREQDQAREAAQGKTQISPPNIKFEQFKKLNVILNSPENATDSRFSSNTNRVKNRIELFDILQQEFKKTELPKTREEFEKFGTTTCTLG